MVRFVRGLHVKRECVRKVIGQETERLGTLPEFTGGAWHALYSTSKDLQFPEG